MIALATRYSKTTFLVSDHAQHHAQHIEFRLPTTRDLIEVARVGSDSTASALVSRCTIGVTNDQQTSVNDVALFQSIVASMEQHDPLSDVEFSMRCTQCDHAFSTSFDIVSFLWSEINAWCKRLMSEVHLLARSYGWTEREILSLSAWRRQVYLNMIRH